MAAVALTLADALPRWRYRSATLVAGFALVTAAAAQISFHLPWTPVPVTGQTFAVLLSGATLGAARGAASQILYISLGLVGLPFYTGGHHGWDHATGATGGYLVGFVMAAALVGHLAERGQDRNVVTALTAMLAGTAVIYVTGVAWLAHVLDVPVAGGVGDSTNAISLGLTPFLLGDAIKLVAAGLATPLAWRIANRA